MPEGLRKTLRPRPAPRLAAGPLPVPISTLDWLLSRESPAARFVALRDLLGRPAKDIELRKARQALGRDLFLRDVLPAVRPMLPPRSATDPGSWPDPGTLLVGLLLEMGCDAEMPEIRHAADVFLARWERTFVEIERSDPPVSPGGLAFTCRLLLKMGHADDPRVAGAADFVARRRVASPGTGESVAPDLLFLASVPEPRRTLAVQRGIDFCVERALAREVPRPAAAGWDASREAIGWPGAGPPDLLEVLEALAAAGVPRERGVRTALERLVRRADQRARWKTDRPFPVRLPVALERPGELSRWASLRALRVLQHFTGLTIAGAPT